MNLIIRQALVTDKEAIAQLSDQLGYKTSAAETESRIEELLTNKEHCLFVCVDGEQVIGWVHGFYALRVESERFVEIGGLVVNEIYRRKGVGKLLVNTIVEWARQININKVRLRCNTKRKDSHLFYLGIGFSETKEQKVFDINLS